MKSKLTLRLEESLIKRAKQKARQRGISVSRMVADYFSLIDVEETPEIKDLPPATASLVGILKNKDVQEKDYKKYLEEKYLR